MQKNTVLTLGLLSLATFGLTTADAGVKLILDNSSPLGMVGETNYDLSNNTIEISLDRPVLCNQAPGYNVGSLTKLRIYDPNDEMKGFISNEGLYFAEDADYMVNNGQLILATDNPAKALCVSAEMGFNDLIFQSSFETTSQTTASVKYLNLPSIVSPGQEINYQIEFNNPSAQPVYFDLLEYWDYNSSQHNAYLSSINERTCNDDDPKVQCYVAQYDDTGVLKGVQLSGGGTFILNVTQTVDSNSGTGEELDFMTGVFLTDGQNGDFLPRTLAGPHFLNNPITTSKTVSVENNNPPQLSWDVAPPALTSFYEDESTPQVFEIRYSDAQTPAASLDVSISYLQGGKLNVATGPFVLDGFDGTMTLDVLPLADAFTDSPEKITVTVTDAGGMTASLTFDVEVIAVNDAPSFTMNCDELTINEQDGELSCTNPIVNRGGNQIQGIWNGHAIIAGFDPGANESHQSVLDYDVTVVDDGGILDMSGNGTPVWISPTTGDINIVNLTGQYGTATVEIRVQDDGGTNGANGCDINAPNYDMTHGCDLSEPQTLTIVSQPYQYSVGGQITGVASGDFKLNIVGTESGSAVNVDTDITTSTDPFNFTMLDASLNPQLLDNGSAYTVSIKAVPFGYDCSLSNGSGTINTNDVTNVQVSCNLIP